MKHLKLFEQFEWDPFGEEINYGNHIKVGDYVILLNDVEMYKRGEVLKVEKILNLTKTFYFIRIPYLHRKLSNNKNIAFYPLSEDFVRKATNEEIKNSKSILHKVMYVLEKDKWTFFKSNEII